MIYGKTGQLSRCLVAKSLKYGFRPIVIGRPEAPIDDLEAISKNIKMFSPVIFINASAYNDVDGAQNDFENAKLVNSTGPMLMARAAKMANIPFIHVSTDYVFSGDKDIPYKENDETNPINAYGESKLLGEINIAKETDNHVIIRTSWVFSPFAKNFVKTLLARAKQDNSPINMIKDQYNTPTSGIDLAKIILEVATRLINEPDNKEIRGIFHVTSQGIASRLEYAQYIFQKAKEFGLPYCEINPVESSFFQTQIKRPKFSALDTSKIKQIYGVEIRKWRDAVDEVFKYIVKS